jgi:hypothetical protein
LSSISSTFTAVAVGFCVLLVLAGPLGAESPPPEPAPEAAPEAEVPTAPPPEPATPRVEVETDWLAPDEAGDGYRLVRGPQPSGATEQLVSLRFRHLGETPAQGLRIVAALPAGTRYVAGSATGPGALVSYSVDGGASFAAPEALVVPDESGDAPPRPATADDYTHIRWDLPGRHAPGTGGLVSFRVRPLEDAG